jgi:hypothetical protein
MTRIERRHDDTKKFLQIKSLNLYKYNKIVLLKYLTKALSHSNIYRKHFDIVIERERDRIHI